MWSKISYLSTSLVCQFVCLNSLTSVGQFAWIWYHMFAFLCSLSLLSPLVLSPQFHDLIVSCVMHLSLGTIVNCNQCCPGPVTCSAMILSVGKQEAFVAIKTPASPVTVSHQAPLVLCLLTGIVWCRWARFSALRKKRNYFHFISDRAILLLVLRGSEPLLSLCFSLAEIRQQAYLLWLQLS